MHHHRCRLPLAPGAGRGGGMENEIKENPTDAISCSSTDRSYGFVYLRCIKKAAGSKKKNTSKPFFLNDGK